jgi:hypothetical protein
VAGAAGESRVILAGEDLNSLKCSDTAHDWHPLPLDRSILVVWPYLTLLPALTLVCFGLSCVVFMRQEIRSV